MGRSRQPLAVAQSLEIALGIAKGLAAIHEQGIVHRDLKPGNILMDRKDDRWVPKIADFGLARSTGSVSLGEFASCGYAAPEQIDLAAEPRLGAESDLFSFGMVLYELLTGTRACDAKDLREYSRWSRERRQPPAASERRPELARFPELEPLLLRLLEFDPARRTVTAADAVKTLSAVCRNVDRAENVVVLHEPASLPPAPPPAAPRADTPPRRARAGPRRSMVVGGSLAAAIALGAFVWLGGDADGSDAARRGLDDFKAQNYIKALPPLTTASENGDTAARSALGRMYLNGWGVQKNLPEARKWLELAAGQRNVEAQCALGDLHLGGLEKKYDEALKRYTAAVSQGAICGQNGLGQMHRLGLGVPPNYDEAARWYEMAAEKGDPEARTALAEMQTGWVLEPLLAGSWRQVIAKDRRDEIARLRASGAAAVEGDVRRMRRLDLDFYENASLYELRHSDAPGRASRHPDLHPRRRSGGASGRQVAADSGAECVRSDSDSTRWRGPSRFSVFTWAPSRATPASSAAWSTTSATCTRCRPPTGPREAVSPGSCGGSTSGRARRVGGEDGAPWNTGPRSSMSNSG